MPAPATRPGSPRPRPQRKGWAGLWRLLIPAGAVLVAALYVGHRPAPTEAQAPARPASHVHLPASTGEAVVLKSRPGTSAPTTVSDAQFSVLDDGKTLRIDGGIGRQFARQLEAVLAEHRFLERIIITSGGGYAGPGLEAGRMIQRHNLIVRVRSMCASMCVGLWAAAAARELEPDALIGLHQWRLDCRAFAEDLRRECEYQGQFATEHDSTYTAWLRSAGFSSRLLALQAGTQSSDIAVLTAPQLWDDGVDFNVVDAQGRTLPRDQVRALLQDRRVTSGG